MLARKENQLSDNGDRDALWNEVDPMAEQTSSPIKPDAQVPAHRAMQSALTPE